MKNFQIFSSALNVGRDKQVLILHVSVLTDVATTAEWHNKCAAPTGEAWFLVFFLSFVHKVFEIIANHRPHIFWDFSF